MESMGTSEASECKVHETTLIPISQAITLNCALSPTIFKFTPVINAVITQVQRFLQGRKKRGNGQVQMVIKSVE